VIPIFAVRGDRNNYDHSGQLTDAAFSASRSDSCLPAAWIAQWIRPPSGRIRRSHDWSDLRLGVLAAKTEVLAIEAALKNKSESDFYVSDLFDLFRFVQERSRFYEAIWLSDLCTSEFPKPYAYLMYQIVADLEDLSCTAVQEATSDSVQRQVARPGRIAHDLAANWSFCIWSIAKSEGQVATDFRNRIIGEHLKFILKLGWEPSEIFGLLVQAVDVS
jgi:hypothetical protein